MKDIGKNILFPRAHWEEDVVKKELICVRNKPKASAISTTAREIRTWPSRRWVYYEWNNFLLHDKAFLLYRRQYFQKEGQCPHFQPTWNRDSTGPIIGKALWAPIFQPEGNALKGTKKWGTMLNYNGCFTSLISQVPSTARNYVHQLLFKYWKLSIETRWNGNWRSL